MNNAARRANREITEQVFANSPPMLALCLTLLGLIKIYAALQRISTLTDNCLVVCVAAFLLSTIFSYLALRSDKEERQNRLSSFADGIFLAGLSGATAVGIGVVFTLAG
jgi:hypothetical protein